MKLKWILMGLLFLLFTSLSYGQSVEKGEYFFNTDPGQGNGTPLVFTTPLDSVNQSFSISTTGLNLGVHRLFVRVKDSLNHWSESRAIYFRIGQSYSPPSGSPSKLVRGEYFFNTDPGQGNGTSFSYSSADSIDQSFSISTSGLNPGVHQLFTRVKDSLGQWSESRAVYFRIGQSYANNNIVSKLASAEYYFGTDPGPGNGIPYTLNITDSLELNINVPTTGLSPGLHIMGFRLRDSLGNWGTAQSFRFLISNNYSAPKSHKIAGLEYFYDTDPGPGNGTALSLNYLDSINQSFSISMMGIDTGYHKLIVRAKDSLGAWSIIGINTFHKNGCSSPLANFSSTDICEGDSLFLNNSTTGTDTLVKYFWDIGNDGVYDFSSLQDTFIIPTSAGTLDIGLKVVNSASLEFTCPDSIVKTVTIHPKPFNQITTYGNSSICPGSSVSLGASAGLGYTYQWLKDGNVIPNATNAIYSAQSNGNYQAAITSFYGCKDTTAISTIGMYSLPTATITVQGSSAFCAGDSVLLQSSTGAGVNYLWYKNGIAQLNDTLSTYTVSDPGSYKVQLTSADGCVDESSPEIITVYPLPTANLYALGNTSFCLGDSVQLKATSGSNYSYTWTKNGSPLSAITGDALFTSDPGSYQVELSDANGCSGISPTISVVVFPIPTSAFSLLNQSCSADTVQIAYSGTATSGAFYNWNFDGGTILSGTGQGPYQVKWDSAGYKNVQLTVSENACQSTLAQQSIEIKAVAASLSSANTSVCQGDSVMLYANGGNHLTYSWYQGGLPIPVGNFSSLAVLQSGNYQVEVTDTVSGCSQLSNPIAAYINPTDFNLDFSANTTTFTQPPFAVTFNNQTPNINNYQFEWDLGDGNTSTFYHPGHSYQYNGDYTVSLFAEDATTGCRDTLIKTDYISCTGGAPNPCNILAAITPAGPVTICGGDSVLLTANAGTGYSYQWVYNNMIITGADSISLWVKQAGNYRVIVSDNVCSQTSPAFVLNHYPSIQPVVQATGQIQPCTFDSLQLSLFVNYNSYNWSTGDTVPSIYVSQTGYYQVAVTDNFGCNLTSQPYVVNNSFLNPPEICIVGVDSANHNRLVWERQANNLIDSFYVYRESFIAGQYVKIGALPFTQTSLFTDTNSNPAIQSYRYKIAAVDTCGGVTLLSDFHKTIHLTINAGLNGSWNLIWDGYQGFPFSTYRIYRGTNANSMSLLTQLPSTATSYTDLNPPTGTVYYQIEVIKNSGCYPDTVTSKANTNYNTSRSNTANNGSIAPIFLTADFNADVISGQWPIQVSFTDISTGLPDSWEWDFGDGNTSIAQHPKHTYNNTGVYTVRLKVCNGTTCDTTTKVGYINVQPNGQVEIGVTLAAKLYPNPNDGSFTLELTTASQKQAQLHIYNSVGQLITQEQLEINQHLRKQIQLNGQAPGVYFVHVSTNKGIVYREKVIIQ